jgi:hypothetical protein
MDDDSAFSTIVNIQEIFEQMDNNLLGEIETDAENIYLFSLSL